MCCWSRAPVFVFFVFPTTNCCATSKLNFIITLCQYIFLASQDDWWWLHHSEESHLAAWNGQQGQVEDCWKYGGGGGESVCWDEMFASADYSSSLSETNADSVLLDVSFFPYVGLCSWGEAFAGETGSAGERSVRLKATTGSRDEGVPQWHPADSPLKHSLPIPVTDDIPFSCCAVQNEKTLAKACEKARTEKKKLQEELAKSREELFKLGDRLADIEAELQSTKQE